VTLRDGSERRLERLPQRARKAFEQRDFDRCARFSSFAYRFVGANGANGFAKNGGDNQAIDALVERDHEPRLGFDALVDRCGQASALADRLKQRG
jgi:hypothetical protein